MLVTEYEQCAEGYRHTYATIWQAGGIAGAISAGLLAFGGDKLVKLGLLPPWQQVLDFLFPVGTLLPVLAWFYTIFEPMDKYAHQKLNRLVAIENEINTLAGVTVSHFTSFKNQSEVKPGVRTRLLRLLVSLGALSILLGFILAATPRAPGAAEQAKVQVKSQHEPAPVSWTG